MNGETESDIVIEVSGLDEVTDTLAEQFSWGERQWK
jgi:hypothetical protein